MAQEPRQPQAPRQQSQPEPEPAVEEPEEESPIGIEEVSDDEASRYAVGGKVMIGIKEMADLLTQVTPGKVIKIRYGETDNIRAVHSVIGKAARDLRLRPEFLRTPEEDRTEGRVLVRFHRMPSSQQQKAA